MTDYTVICDIAVQKAAVVHKGPEEPTLRTTKAR